MAKPNVAVSQHDKAVRKAAEQAAEEILKMIVHALPWYPSKDEITAVICQNIERVTEVPKNTSH